MEHHQVQMPQLQLQQQTLHNQLLLQLPQLRIQPQIQTPLNLAHPNHLQITLVRQLQLQQLILPNLVHLNHLQIILAPQARLQVQPNQLMQYSYRQHLLLTLRHTPIPHLLPPRHKRPSLRQLW